MCGLAGIVSANARERPNEGVVRAMRDVQSHRGPDDAGIYISAGVAFGHRRLSIIDLEHGKQPMLDQESGLVLIFNGEIYNFHILRKELEALGATFTSCSDTEVLLKAWRLWGKRCVNKLVGMFAFAVWDPRQRSIHLVRDHIGIKPLYYGFTDRGDMVFSSELKGVLAHHGISRTLNPQAVEDYLAFGYVPDPKSIYRDVFKLPPGHLFCWQGGQPSPNPEQYWDLNFSALGETDFDDATHQFRHLLDNSVASQLISDVPLGAFLSGGLDSSSVVASMSRVSSSPVHTCCIGFEKARFDERQYAREIAEFLHTQHVEGLVDAEDFTLVDTLAGLYDEPFADSSALPTYRVCELARRHVTVALSGDGGDENFAGYRRHRWQWREGRVRAALPMFLRRYLFGALGFVYPKGDWAPQVLRAKTTLQSLACNDVDAYFHSVSFVPRSLRKKLYTPTFKRDLQGYDAVEVFRAHASKASTRHPLLLAQYLDFKTSLPGDILTKVDRASMAHSLEVRVPFLDHHLVEWACTLPPKFKIRDGIGKRIVKTALEAQLPDYLFNRKKMGFSVPLAAWFRGPLKRSIRNAVSGEAFSNSEIINHQVAEQLVIQHQRGARNYATPLWSLLMLDAFLGGPHLSRADESAVDTNRGNIVKGLESETH